MPHRPHQPSARLQIGEFAFTKKGVSRFDLRDPYHLAVSLTWPQFFALLLGLYLTVNLIFAALYTAVPGALANARPHSFSDAFFFSFETLATVGYGEMYPGNLYGHFVAASEIVCGLAFTAILTGLTFVRFSRPRAKFVFATNPVVARHNKLPTMMLRIANARPGLLTDVHVRWDVLLREDTVEGSSFRRTHELELLRNQLPILPMTWTIMHVLDERSPLHGMDIDMLKAADVRMFISIDARDPSLGATVYDLHYYRPHDLAFGMRYVDAVSVDSDGGTTIDLALLSVLEPEVTAHGSGGELA